MNYNFFHSPIGILYLESTEKGLCTVAIVDGKDIHDAHSHPFIEQAITELKEYFAGKRKKFTVPVDLSKGTSFQQSVWHKVSEIPHGTTTSYIALARDLGNPGSVRAVGAANGKNPVPVIVPCHRVIGSSGDLVGYALGIDIKRKLLMLENPKVFGEQTSLF